MNGFPVNVIQFDNLKEFLKTQDSRYILKFDIDEESSVYYSVCSLNSCDMIIFCIDKKFNSEAIKFIDGKYVETNDVVNSIALANVNNDTFLVEILDSYFGEDEEKPKKKKKK